MENIKTTFITTVFNEEKTITQFLTSLFSQSKLPDEIIIVDAGSTDKTVQMIKDPHFAKALMGKQVLSIKNKNINVSIVIKKGNRSMGRNTAIKKAKGNIILCSDAGCILDKDWVKNILEPFKNKKIDVVSGFYKPITKNIFEKCLSTYTSVMQDRIDKDNFLPSSRSVAFKKSAWEKVNGYPEDLDTCEDLVFDKKLKKENFTFYFQESAFVFWPQRKNLWQAAKQFFSYAFGDGKALYFRKQTPLLFLRYFLGFVILSLSSLFNKLQLGLLVLGIGLIFYLLWAIWKNYKYTRDFRAFFWLPVLQITSDIFVILGMKFGLIANFFPKLLDVIKNNKIISLIIICYILVFLQGINWGIVNNNHPFNYYMDEWASAFSVRTLFRHGSPNINGGAHGVVGFYFFSGIYLFLFVLLHIVNPFIITSPFTHIAEQHLMFQVLRSYSLLNGIATIITLAIISKKYLKSSSILSVIFITTTPLFLEWSLFFKYDLAVTFWITLSILFGLNFIKEPSRKNYLLLGIISAIAVCTKISAAPLFLIFILSFFLFIPNFKNKYKWLFTGFFIFVLIFLFLGIPDIFIASHEFLNSIIVNLTTGPQNGVTNKQLGVPYQLFLLEAHYPAIFGHIFYVIFILSVIFITIKSFKVILKKNLIQIDKNYIFLTFSFFAFLISLLPLKIGASGNRMLVIMPYLALFSSIFFAKIINFLKNHSLKIIFFIFLFLAISIQVIETFIIYSPSIFYPDPRQSSSIWIQKNIKKGSTIGIEDVPIFQQLPDVILKEYYLKQYFPKSNLQNNYNYQIVGSQTSNFPSLIVITDSNPELKFVKKSLKNDLVKTIKKLGYKEFIKFTPDQRFLHFLYKEEDLYYIIYNNIPINISIFKK